MGKWKLKPFQMVWAKTILLNSFLGQHSSKHLWVIYAYPTLLEYFGLRCWSVRIPSVMDFPVTVDVQSCCSSSIPAEPHHNTGRCSQIPCRLHPEAHWPAGSVWKWYFWFGCVLSLEARIPLMLLWALLLMIDWNMNLCMRSLQSLYVCWGFML